MNAGNNNENKEQKSKPGSVKDHDIVVPQNLQKTQENPSKKNSQRVSGINSPKFEIKKILIPFFSGKILLFQVKITAMLSIKLPNN